MTAVLPAISIITPSFNQSDYLESTIQSVLAQNFPKLEYSVIDGGSTDGTLAILRQYSHRLTWLSEPDEGQAQAINKGLRRANGEIVAWLNSDDIYLPDALPAVAEFFSAHPAIDVVYGDYYLIDGRGKILLRKREIPFDYNILLYGLNYIGQPAAFFRRRVLERFGYLDENLHYGLDWEYWLRVASGGGQFAHLPRYLAATRIHTAAKTIVAPPQMFAEHRAIQARYWAARRFESPGVQRIYARALRFGYRAKRQLKKLLLRRTIDFPPAHWVMDSARR